MLFHEKERQRCPSRCYNETSNFCAILKGRFRLYSIFNHDSTSLILVLFI